MKNRVRRFVRWGLWGLTILSVLAGLYLSVFFFPYPLFPHHAELSGFDVYSDRDLPEELEDVFEDARRRVEAMELYRGVALSRFFLCQSQSRCAFITRLAGKRQVGQGLLISVAGNAFLSEAMIESIGRRNGGRPIHSRLEGSTAAAVAHEVAHDLLRAEVGFKRTRRIPVWIAEGYADYSANLASARADPEYDFRSRIELLLDDDAWRSPRESVDRRHFRWHLLVEHLLTADGLELTDLLAEPVTEADAWNQIMEWYEAGTRL